MKKILLFISIAVFFASCSSKPKIGLEVNIHNNTSLMNKKLIVNQLIDGAVVYSDTTKIRKYSFLKEIPYQGPALIKISVQNSNVGDIMMAAEEGTIQLSIEGIKPYFGGTPLNDRLQAFHNESDSVYLIFKELDNEYELQRNADTSTPKMKEELKQKSEELMQRRNQLLIENTDRIIAFIKENVDNPVGEYYFMTNYITFTLERKLELHSFATEKLKKEFRIK